MSYDLKELLQDANTDFIPQYFNEIIDNFEELKGRNGASFAELLAADGNPMELEKILGAIADVAETDPAQAANMIQLLKGLMTNIGQKTDSPATGSGVDGSLVALLKELRDLLTDGDAKVTQNGSTASTSGTVESNSTVSASGGTEYMNLFANSGKVADLLHYGIKIPAPSGAASGNHRIVVGYTGINKEYRMLDLEVPYNEDINVSNGVVLSSNINDVTPADKAVQLSNFQNKRLTDSVEIMLIYFNNTDVDQTQNKKIDYIWTEENAK